MNEKHVSVQALRASLDARIRSLIVKLQTAEWADEQRTSYWSQLLGALNEALRIYRLAGATSDDIRSLEQYACEGGRFEFARWIQWRTPQ